MLHHQHSAFALQLPMAAMDTVLTNSISEILHLVAKEYINVCCKAKKVMHHLIAIFTSHSNDSLTLRLHSAINSNIFNHPLNNLSESQYKSLTNERVIIVIVVGAWCLIGRFDAFCSKDCGFESRSSHH